MGIFPTRFLNKFLLALGGLAIIALIVSSAYFYWQYRQLASQNTANEIAKITRHLSKFMELPSDSTPTLATVTEKEKLMDQDFFKNAENGDKVLIYLDEGKAILYRPSTGKVIDVAPVRKTDTLSQDGLASDENTDTESTERIAISVFNGSAQAGIAAETLSKLEDVTFPYTEGSTRNANQQNYTQTVVVDLDGSHLNEAREVADLIGGVVGALPDGETAPEGGGLLIIVGRVVAAPTPTPTPSPAPETQEIESQ